MRAIDAVRKILVTVDVGATAATRRMIANVTFLDEVVAFSLDAVGAWLVGPPMPPRSRERGNDITTSETGFVVIRGSRVTVSTV